MDLETFTLAAVCSSLEGDPSPGLADAIEFRMDHASDPLSQLSAYRGTLPIIATNRAHWEGGAAEDPDRLRTLASAARESTVTAVDVELESVLAGETEPVVDAAREHGINVIVSWHDFDETPPRDLLRQKLRQAADVGDVAKAAVTAHDVGDVLDLLSVTYELSQAGSRVATMSMGTVGRHSRVIAPLYGSCIGYAPVSLDESTAPGQFDLETFASLLTAVR